MTFDGLWDLSFWGYVAVTLALTHVTIASVTIFLHRHQAHRALTLHPVVSHFFRFWLWLTTGMVTREWVADPPQAPRQAAKPTEDPHSPQVYGIWRVLFGGVGLYRTEAIEDARRSRPTAAARPTTGSSATSTAAIVSAGSASRSLVDLVLFGWVGLVIFAVQMALDSVLGRRRHQRRRPLLGLSKLRDPGHVAQHRADRHPDRRRGVPQQPSRVRLVGQAREQVVGARHRLGLHPHARAARPREREEGLAARVVLTRARAPIDLDTLRAVVTNRFYVLKLYGRRVIAPVLHGHAAGEPSFPRRQLARVRKLMIRENSGLREDPHARQWLENALQRNQTLRTVYTFMQRLKALSAQTTGKTESDLKPLAGLVCRGGSERHPRARRFRATITSLHGTARLEGGAPHRFDGGICGPAAIGGG